MTSAAPPGGDPAGPAAPLLPTADAEGRERFWELVGALQFGMLVSRGPDGSLRARPLTTQNARDDRGDELVFFVPANSEVAQDVDRVPEVLVVYADPGNDAYVSVGGQARVVRHLERQRALWSPLADAWFPGGADDAALRLLCVRIGSAEYWDIRTSKPMQLFKLVAAAWTGQPPDDLGEHRRIRP